MKGRLPESLNNTAVKVCPRIGETLLKQQQEARLGSRITNIRKDAVINGGEDDGNGDYPARKWKDAEDSGNTAEKRESARR